MNQNKKLNLKIGVSSCLIGERVRFNGDHKRDNYIADVLSQFVDFVPVCPEVDVGMGAPRESVHLIGKKEAPRMVGTKTGKEWTQKMKEYSRKKMKALVRENLDGFICKKGSPSCGLERVRVYGKGGAYDNGGVGMFTRALTETFPELPVEEEGRLNDENLRENFIIRVFSFHRLKHEVLSHFTPNKLVRFHTRHKFILMAHNVEKYRALGRLVAEVKKYKPSEFKNSYARPFMEILKTKSTNKKNANVLQHLMGYFKTHLTPDEKKELNELIDQYRREIIPLIVPLTLIKHYVKKFGVDYVSDQVYLNPHPQEIKLRYRV